MHAWMLVSVEDDGGMDIWLSCTEGATPESPSAALPDNASLSCGWGAWRLSGVLSLKLCAAREIVFCSQHTSMGARTKLVWHGHDRVCDYDEQKLP